MFERKTNFLKNILKYPTQKSTYILFNWSIVIFVVPFKSNLYQVQKISLPLQMSLEKNLGFEAKNQTMTTFKKIKLLLEIKLAK